MPGMNFEHASADTKSREVAYAKSSMGMGDQSAAGRIFAICSPSE